MKFGFPTSLIGQWESPTDVFYLRERNVLGIGVYPSLSYSI